jgi:adenine-specific DNA methylase
MMKRWIEEDFPLEKTSLDAVHEKNVRHGHISTLHIWPARRPLAACRAALITTLLSDPETTRERKMMLEKLAGGATEQAVSKRSIDGGTSWQDSKETKGGILHWGRESSQDVQWFRDKIRAEYGGQAPKVLDPFAGGGAIPLEAMRLGCDVTAMDINPVAWFLLKCTLEYPKLLAGKSRPLPAFVCESRAFMEGFFKAKGLRGEALRHQLSLFGLLEEEEAGQQTFPGMLVRIPVEANLAWHVRAWGWWVLQQARSELTPFYPVVDERPTVGYLWARTITCKNCRATIPLLKTRWLCKKEKKRVVLTMEPNERRTGVVFGILNDAPKLEQGSTTEQREHDKQLGGGTMSSTGVTCPCCRTVFSLADIRKGGQAGRLGTVMTAVVVEGKKDKEYRLPTDEERQMTAEAEQALPELFTHIPFGIPDEPVPKGGSGASRAFSVDGYGFDCWYKLFTPRQLLALGIFVKYTRTVREEMGTLGYPSVWIEVVSAFLALAIDRLADYSSSVCSWHNGREILRNTFGRFALPIIWDFAEVRPDAETSGGYFGAIEWIARYIEHAMEGIAPDSCIEVRKDSAISTLGDGFDVIITDPPYYDAIPYSDLMDFFYVWLRRTLHGLTEEIDAAFSSPLAPKWDHERNDGELIDDASRFGGDKQASKKNYEVGMYRAFQACHHALAQDGRLVVVFAHKKPDAWETLVSAIIRAGFVVTTSWPIQTEMGNRTRALSSAALAASLWLVCSKRVDNARYGWDNLVLAEMKQNIEKKMHDFWDAGIRGPDFVWAATGPALEAYSKYPIVKKADERGKELSVDEFLGHARRMVADFMVGHVFSKGGAEALSGLDDVTTYYLLHREYFGLDRVPVGPCILYAISCGLDDNKDLVNKYDVLVRTSNKLEEDEGGTDENDMPADNGVKGSGSMVKLKPWSQRRLVGKERVDLFGGPPSPLIDHVHYLMRLWNAGDVISVERYLEGHGLRQNRLFIPILQALLNLAAKSRSSDEQRLLSNLIDYVNPRSRLSVQHLFSD